MKPLSAASAQPPLLRLTGLGKSFGTVRVLENVSFDVLAGEVHILAGENGAGKSSLIKILAGIHPEHDGSMAINGRPVKFDRPQDAAAAGIAVIHQELSLIDAMSVLDNLTLGREPRRWGGWLLDRHQQRQRAAELVRDLHLGLTDQELNAPVESLSLSNKNRVEIAKALASDSRIIIMDEPTSALDRPDVERLFALIEGLKARGCGIIFISHRMDEIYRLADRITVLRDGQWVGTAPASDCPEPTLIHWMAGREVGEGLPRRAPPQGRPGVRPRLELRRLKVPQPARPDAVADLSLRVVAGEILGLAGLQGSGNTACFEALFGLRKTATAETIEIDGVAFRPSGPADSIRHGLAYLTGDRKATGLVLGLAVDTNVALASLPAVSPGGWLRPAALRARARHWAEALRIRASSLEQPVGTLSGGNQQKVALAKWLETRPKVLLLEEPTRGVDVQAKREIHALMRRWTEEGMAILLITSELPELLSLSDRIVVLHRGEVTGEFDAATATPETVLAAALGSS